MKVAREVEFARQSLRAELGYVSGLMGFVAQNIHALDDDEADEVLERLLGLRDAICRVGGEVGDAVFARTATHMANLSGLIGDYADCYSPEAAAEIADAAEGLARAIRRRADGVVAPPGAVPGGRP